MSISEELRARGQEHLLRFWNQLNEAEQARFEEQIKRIDWSLIDEIDKPERTALGDVQPIEGMSIA